MQCFHSIVVESCSSATLIFLCFDSSNSNNNTIFKENAILAIAFQVESMINIIDSFHIFYSSKDKFFYQIDTF